MNQIRTGLSSKLPVNCMILRDIVKYFFWGFNLLLNFNFLREEELQSKLLIYCELSYLVAFKDI